MSDYVSRSGVKIGLQDRDLLAERILIADMVVTGFEWYFGTCRGPAPGEGHAKLYWNPGCHALLLLQRNYIFCAALRDAWLHFQIVFSAQLQSFLVAFHGLATPE